MLFLDLNSFLYLFDEIFNIVGFELVNFKFLFLIFIGVLLVNLEIILATCDIDK